MSHIRQILAILQAVLQVWVPACLLCWSVAWPLPAFADRFSDTARQGQSLGRGLIPNASSLADRDEAGNVNLHYGGQTSTFNPGQLFPDSQSTSDPHADEAFGNDAQLMNRANSETQTLGNSNSFTGQAYQTLLGSVDRARVDMSNDPLWQQTDAAIERALSGVDTNCEIITTSNATTSQAHVPDIETCERVHYPGAQCKCHHDYTVEFVGQYSVSGVQALVAPYVHAQVRVNLQTGSVSCSNCSSPSANISRPPSDICTPSGEGVRRMITTTDFYASTSLTQAPTCENGWIAVFSLAVPTGYNPKWVIGGIIVTRQGGQN
jgi:hypothetical protein